MKRRLPLPVLLWVAGTAATAQRLGVPPLSESESGRVIARDRDGNPRWEGRWKLARKSEGERVLVSFREEGEGVYWPFTRPVSWTLKSLWEARSRLVPVSAEREFRNSRGEVLVREHKTFDPARRRARFERTDLRTGKTLTETFDAPPDTIFTEGIAAALRGLPFDSRRPVKIHLLTSEPRLYEITVQVHAEESVATPYGAYPSCKVELKANLGLLSVFRRFVPRTYFWFKNEEPFDWVRYEGYEVGRSSPRVVMEPGEKP